MQIIAAFIFTLFSTSAFAHSSHMDEDAAPVAKKDMQQKYAAKHDKAAQTKEKKKAVKPAELKTEAKKQ